MKKQILIYQDPDNEIILSKDHYHGIVVQVVRKVDQMVNTNEGLVNQRTNQVPFSKIVKITTTFKKDIDTAIGEAKYFISQILKQDEEINGMLNDYLSQNRDLNEPANQ